MEGIKIEVGKYYLTSKGKRAYVASRTPVNLDLKNAVNDGHHFAGFIQGRDDFFCWQEDGTSYISGCDLVSEWEEPKRIKGFINIIPIRNSDKFMTSGVWDTRHDADCSDQRNDANRVACIEIDVLEGQGLDGSAQ